MKSQQASLYHFSRLLQQIQPLRSRVMLAVFLGVATIASGIGLMTLSAYLISEAALHPALAGLAAAIAGVRIFGILRGILRYLERLVSHDITFRLLAKFRVWFYQALEPLVPARLVELGETHRYSSGDLLSRFVADIETLQDFYIRAIAPSLVAVVIGLGTWWLLLSFNSAFALTFLAFYLLTSVVLPLLAHQLSKSAGEQLITRRSRLRTTLVDSLRGSADLLAFGQDQQQLRDLRIQNLQLVRTQTTIASISGLRDALGILFTDGCTWVMLLVAIPLVHSGHLNGVYLALLVLAAIGSFEATLPLATAAQQVKSTLEASKRLFEAIDAVPVVTDPVSASPTPATYDLEVRHLSFQYTAQTPPVLQDISLTIPAGHCIALVGPSGAGKSTLAHLLLHFWEYEQGDIFLSGQSLHTYHQQDLRRLISVVEQRPHLFHATVRENLLIARTDASMPEITHAMQLAHLHESIQALPRGYDTIIGEQGFKLSAGERQRLSIARAILKDAPILILDEATAHLDAFTEQAILQTIRSLLTGRTTLMITHRLVALDMADEILVMQARKIRERGTHNDLLQAHGLYWKLWQLQNQTIAPYP